MLVTKKIMWQKYENVIEDQINSPLLDIISRSIGDEEEMGSLSGIERDFHDEEVSLSQKLLVAVPDDLSSEISLTANFDCWVGHTNFNVTRPVSESLEKTTGVEVLKICSRYRFFIGIGRMFDFADVRRNIEDALLIES